MADAQRRCFFWGAVMARTGLALTDHQGVRCRRMGWELIDIIAIAYNLFFVGIGWGICRWQHRLQINFTKVMGEKLDPHFEEKYKTSPVSTRLVEWEGRAFRIVSDPIALMTLNHWLDKQVEETEKK